MKRTVKDVIYVAIQLLLFVAFLFNPSLLKVAVPGFVSVIGGVLLLLGLVIIIVAIFQLNKNLSAFPTPKAGSQLVEKGLYKKIRHPIYSGILLAGLGLSVATGSGFRLIATVLLLILFYFKSGFEEKQLSAIFPDYENYKKRTGRFAAPLR